MKETQFERIDRILGKSKDSTRDDNIQCWFDFLNKELIFQIEVTGIEDFKWEEMYLFKPQLEEEYEELKQKQPSYTDIFILKGIDIDNDSEWMLHPYEDISASVVRKNDGKEFVLGLSELEVINKKESSYQTLNDYAVFFCNYLRLKQYIISITIQSSENFTSFRNCPVKIESGFALASRRSYM